MNEQDRLIFEEFASRIYRQFSHAKVWLYGSRARGDSKPDSDFDLLVVIDPLTRQNKKIISNIAWEVGFEKNLVLAPIVYSFEKFYYPAIQKSPFIGNVLREGVLY